MSLIATAITLIFYALMLDGRCVVSYYSQVMLSRYNFNRYILMYCAPIPLVRFE